MDRRERFLVTQLRDKVRESVPSQSLSRKNSVDSAALSQRSGAGGRLPGCGPPRRWEGGQGARGPQQTRDRQRWALPGAIPSLWGSSQDPAGPPHTHTHQWMPRIRLPLPVSPQHHVLAWPAGAMNKQTNERMNERTSECSVESRPGPKPVPSPACTTRPRRPCLGGCWLWSWRGGTAFLRVEKQPALPPLPPPAPRVTAALRGAPIPQTQTRRAGWGTSPKRRITLGSAFQPSRGAHRAPCSSGPAGGPVTCPRPSSGTPAGAASQRQARMAATPKEFVISPF